MAKLRELFQMARQFRKNLEAAAAGEEVSVSLGPKAKSPKQGENEGKEKENRVEVQEEIIVPKTAYVCGADNSAKKSPAHPTPPPRHQVKKSPSSPTSKKMPATPTSPVEGELLALERRRLEELESAKRRREIETRRTLTRLREEARARVEERMGQLSREEEQRRMEAESRARQAREEEERSQRAMQEQARRRAEDARAELRALEEREARERLRVALRQAEAVPAEEGEATAAFAGLAEAVRSARTLLTAAVDPGRCAEAVELLQSRRTEVIKEMGLREKEAERARLAQEEEDRRRQQAEKQAAAEAAAAAALEAAKEQERRRIEDELRLKEEQEKKKQQEAAAAAAAAAALAVKPEAPVAAPVAAATAGGSAQLHQEASGRNRARLEEAAAFRAQWAARLEPFLRESEADANVKRFKFACQKAVSTPVNAVSATSSAHLRDKLDKLRSLLAGEAVEVGAGGQRLSAAQHPLGVAFCMDVAARKLVGQGEEVVSSKPEYAFSMGTVVASLWAEFPDFGRLFLAHLFEACPYLVPCHFARRYCTDRMSPLFSFSESK